MYIGMDVGGSHIGTALLDDEFNIIDSTDIYISNITTQEEVLTGIKNSIEKYIDNDIKYIGIGFPGVCDIQNKKVLKVSNIKYTNVIIEYIQTQFNLPIYIDNDANCATIAEHYKGSLKGIENGILLTIGTGIGSGIIINNKIYRGKNYCAGEIGHMLFQKDGIECGCGKKGCFEKYAAMSVLKKAMNLRKIQVEQLQNIFIQDDENMIKIYNEWLDNLAQGIVNISNILDPEKIVLGGGICKIFEYIKPKLMDNIEKIKHSSEQQIIIDKATLNNDAGMIGAALLGKI